MNYNRCQSRLLELSLDDIQSLRRLQIPFTRFSISRIVFEVFSVVFYVAIIFELL